MTKPAGRRRDQIHGVGEVAAQFAGTLRLGEEFPCLGLGGLDSVRAGGEGPRGRCRCRDRVQNP